MRTRRCVAWAGLGLALALGGCAQNSPYIRFVNQPFEKVEGEKLKVTHYVQIQDPASKEPIRNLQASNFIVSAAGKNVTPVVQPSSRYPTDWIGLAVVIDCGGPKGDRWRALVDVADYALREIPKDKAALMVANGTQPVRFAWETPASVQGKLNQLKPEGTGSEGNLPAIDEVKGSGRTGLPAHTRVAILAIISGASSSGGAAEIKPNGPLVVVDVGNANDENLRRLATESGGLYLTANRSNARSVAQAAMRRIKEWNADQYAITFYAGKNDRPIRYSLTYKGQNVTAKADYVHDAWAMQLAVLAGIAVAILAIVVLIIARRRTAGSGPAAVPIGAHGWSEASNPTLAAYGSGPGGGDAGDTTSGLPGFDSATPGGAAGASFNWSAPAQDSTLAEQRPGAAPGGYANPGDVTAGALTSAPTMGVYAGGYAGDSTMAELNAAAPAASFAATMLRIDTGPAAGRECAITSNMRIGRGQMFQCQDGALMLPGDPKVSREHAELRLEVVGGRPEWTLVHRSTTNKTYVNDMPVDGQRRLNTHDRIRVGDTVITVIDMPTDSTMR